MEKDEISYDEWTEILEEVRKAGWSDARLAKEVNHDKTLVEVD